MFFTCEDHLAIYYIKAGARFYFSFFNNCAMGFVCLFFSFFLSSVSKSVSRSRSQSNRESVSQPICQSNRLTPAVN